MIALALTALERELLGERPAFFCDSRKTGGGKTTAINMIAIALTGKRAAAAAWSANEEERRKSIFAALLQGVPLIVSDNIKPGTSLTCTTIEKVLTSTELGSSRIANNARTMHRNPHIYRHNIAPKGDLASRSLITRIDVDRPDPQNRDFRHPDPFTWTLDHRGRFIEAPARQSAL